MSDVFISYSSDNADWAKKIHDLLRTRMPGTTTFLDSVSLRAGDDWELRIAGALNTTRNMIVLWSKAAGDSDWVRRELATFQNFVAMDTSRRLVMINLEGMNESTKRHHQIISPALQAAYPNAAAVSEAQWKQLAQQIEDALNPERARLEVPLVILSVNQQQLTALDAPRRDWITHDYQIKYDALLAQYAATPASWRPFSSTDTVASIFDAVRTNVNGALKQHLLAWKEPQPDFWTDTKAARAFVDEEFKTAELSILVVDPVSISHPDIYQRLMYFHECLFDNRTIIIALPPFGLADGLTRLRNSLLERASPYFDDYFKPPVPPRRKIAAHCCWNVNDSDDIRRHILAAAGQIIQETRPTERPAFLSQGRTSPQPS